MDIVFATALERIYNTKIVQHIADQALNMFSQSSDD